METFLVPSKFESTFADAAGNVYVRTGSVDVEQAAHPRAVEAQARAVFAATSKGSILTVSVRTKTCSADSTVSEALASAITA
jgi:hypothetical protein